MAEERSVTKLVSKTREGESEAANALLQHFWEVARQTARRHLTASIRRVEDEDDIANAALRSALSHLRQPKGEKIRSRDDFEDLVLMIVRRKATSAKRRALAAKRDVRRFASLPEVEAFRDGGTATPDEFAKAGELAKRMEKIVMQEPNKQYRAIGLLHVMNKWDVGQICEAFAKSRPKSGVPARRTVQIGVQLARERIAAALRDEYGKLLQDKEEGVKKKKTPSAHPSGKGTKRSAEKDGAKEKQTNKKNKAAAAKKTPGDRARKR